MIIVTDKNKTYNPTGVMSKYFKVGPITYSVDCIHSYGRTFSIEFIDDIPNVYIETKLEYNKKIYSFSSFGYWALNNQKNIESVEIDDNKLYYSKDGILYQRAFDIINLFYYPRAKKDKILIIDENIDLINRYSLIDKNPYLETIVYKNKKLKIKNNKVVLCR